MIMRTKVEHLCSLRLIVEIYLLILYHSRGQLKVVSDISLSIMELHVAVQSMNVSFFYFFSNKYLALNFRLSFFPIHGSFNVLGAKGRNLYRPLS